MQSLNKFFSNFYSAFLNEDCEEILMALLFVVVDITYVYSHSDLK